MECSLDLLLRDTRKFSKNLTLLQTPFLIHFHVISYFRIRMKPAPLLKIDDDLERMFKYVNYTFNSDTRDAWFDIFSYWGSHYISEFELGGWVEMESHINTKRLRTVNIDYIKVLLKVMELIHFTLD